MASDDLTMAAVSALRPGQDVIGVFACVRKDRLSTRTGSAYLALELRDRTGTVPARAFQNADELAGRFERGDIVRVRARVERFRDQLTLEVIDIARVAPEDAVDPGRFLPTAYRDLDELDGFLEHLAGEVYDRGFRALLETLLADDELRAAWRRAPCTRGGHHSYLGGLLEHTVAVTTLAHEACQLHPKLNSDLLLTAALVHDLGRTREFTYGAEIGLTEEGRLLGHLTLGEQLLSERMTLLGGASGGLGTGAASGISESARLELLHCVLAHHGPATAPGGRFGSAEALALFRLNALDATVKGALEHGLPS
ncbi:MAG: OB-fold nucleic acid binding domain-containing protein [Actinomycetota bacterium]|nr:OB-fold nucleic acid binding domain-containing protein [Actinomycetota bacterium]